MTELLLTHVDESQPYDSTETRLHLYGRDVENPLQRREVVVTGFRPYFYVRAEEAKADEDWLLGQDCISVIDYGADEQPFGGDEELAKVYVPYPQDARDARELFDRTWNADVPFTNRFLIDTGIEAYVEVPEHAIGEDSRTVDYSEIEPLATPSSEG
jgi:DNA polymerase I